ncbi:hypothetical protein ACFW96_28985 [Streptomyces gardneri]|uniref:hypothetical protein n=1 Tax=Streptomyces gardneri TaxID=66892 RepID=UPI00367EFE6C
MAHCVGHRQVQGVLVGAVVVGVARDVGGRYQCVGEPAAQAERLAEPAEHVVGPGRGGSFGHRNGRAVAVDQHREQFGLLFLDSGVVGAAAGEHAVHHRQVEIEEEPGQNGEAAAAVLVARPSVVEKHVGQLVQDDVRLTDTAGGGLVEHDVRNIAQTQPETAHTRLGADGLRQREQMEGAAAALGDGGAEAFHVQRMGDVQVLQDAGEPGIDV